MFLTITGCTFVKGADISIPDLGYEKLEIDHVLIQDEYIAHAITEEEILKCLKGRAGKVRIGFCQRCGIAAAYEDDFTTWKHPSDNENIVRCILKS